MPDTILQYGASYRFGFASTNAPAITGVVPRSAELSWEPEFFGQANDKEAHAAAIVVSKPSKRKIAAIFIGYCLATFNPANVPNNFSFIGRRFIVRKISDPYKKGEFNEVAIEAESFANIF